MEQSEMSLKSFNTIVENLLRFKQFLLWKYGLAFTRKMIMRLVISQDRLCSYIPPLSWEFWIENVQTIFLQLELFHFVNFTLDFNRVGYQVYMTMYYQVNIEN